LDGFNQSFKKGIYHFDRSLGDQKTTTLIINFEMFLDDKIPYELFPFSTARFIKQLVRDIRLNSLID